MAIENSGSYYFYLSSSIVLTVQSAMGIHPNAKTLNLDGISVQLLWMVIPSKPQV